MMKTRQLGKSGLKVSAVGLGCMGMSEFYGTGDEAEAVATIHRALDLGVNLLDTADMYGLGANETLLGKAIRDRRGQVVLATKFGNVRDATGKFLGVNGRPEYVRSACEASLKRLGLDVIDLYYQHRVDPGVPIEDTVGAMRDLVLAGKVRFLGLSEAAPQTLRRAVKVHPIAALQTEYSLWTRDVEGEILPVCRELGIGFVAYSPLGRGFLTGRIKKIEDLSDADWRRNSPRFQAANLERNLELVHCIERTAKAKHCTPAQLALAWVLAQGDDIVPIPGTKRRLYLEENLEALSVKPWGFGFRAVGNETFSKTGGLQFQSIKVDSARTGRNTFYLWDLMLGMEYIAPKVQGKPLRFTASAVADLGMSDTTLYAAPVISVGLLYTTVEDAATPTGLTFDIYYRLTDIDLDNVGGGAGTLKPALGFKMGYIFEGFWTTKEK